MSKSGKILVAVAAGIAAGAVLGILFAPGKGSETRKKLNKKAQKIADEVKEKFNGLKEELEKKVKEAGEELA
ncbi:MAG: YtxH domain-containing protein [Chitinophagaceae bacterium]|nr:YtxH domain-containing protein [Chitinophagaceae bacterium]MBK7306921.1 YtxH domain-containing protein [Chitinophagaceae bacterium]MBK8788506.1 YtxH domain-containing protein [Chitinophagaceae bacterium]MBK9486554.1 YtxH domain-containing protein [Chitinophagaceae bacterium]MBL0202067.1 YtxH domain-containing protein [Chitinophagaceae bacterium]